MSQLEFTRSIYLHHDWLMSFPFSLMLKIKKKKILHQASRRFWQMRWSQDGSASICCLWLGLIDTSVLSAVSRVHTSILCSNSVYLCYNSCSCHTSVFIFFQFLLELHQCQTFPTFTDLIPYSKVSFRLPSHQRCFGAESPKGCHPLYAL